MNSDSQYDKIGLFSSDPLSPRCADLEKELHNLGAQPHRIYPWQVRQTFSGTDYEVRSASTDILDLQIVYVLDIGALDIGSYLHRIGLLTMLEEHGIEVVNAVEAIKIMRNKAETLRHLKKVGICIPRTLVTESIDVASAFARELGGCVVKPIIGFGGAGVQYIHEQFDLDNIYDLLKFHTQMFGKGAFLLQEYIKSPGFDIRALVVDGEMISSMQRVSRRGFLTNIHAGGVPRVNDIDVNELAIQAAESTGGRIVGVDILPDQEGDLLVLEVNATPGWNGLQRVTGFNIAQRIAETLVFRR